MRTVCTIIPLLIANISTLASGQEVASNTLSELAAVRKAIEEKGASWIAGETWVSQLPPEERRALCGEISVRTLGKLPDDEQVLRYPSHPERFDWRDVNGENWTTPIRNQGGCGSCAAFSAIGAMEAVADIYFGDPHLNLNLSEQHLFSCGCGACCETGWTVSEACEYLTDYGVPDEGCFAYSGNDLSCNWTCSDWESRVTKISCWNWVGNTSHVSTTAGIKEKLLEGPLAASMTVYSDFNYYSGGVYEHVTGGEEAGHGIVIVGWDDTTEPPCWICKNSWGTGWGESGGGEAGGWFRIKMGTNHCGIEEGVIFMRMGDLPDVDISENFHNFETVETGETSEWILPVNNNGAAVLEIYDVSIELEDFGIIPSNFPQFVNPGESLPLTYIFSPSTTEIQAFISTIYTNDCREPELYIRLMGMGAETKKVVIELMGLCGMPGEHLHLPIDLDNQNYQDIPCSQVELSIIYDETLININEVTSTERTQNLNFFTWEVNAPGTLKVTALDTTGIMIDVGTGSIADISLSIAGGGHFGQVAQVTIQEHLVLDAMGEAVQAETQDGYVGVYCRGDVNLDGRINVLDMVKTVNFILNVGEPPTEYQLWAADCSGDGNIDISDIVGMVEAMLGYQFCQP